MTWVGDEGRGGDFVGFGYGNMGVGLPVRAISMSKQCSLIVGNRG